MVIPHSTCLPLTPREWEVLCLLAEGWQRHEIAARLVISERTVGKHVENILSKLGARNSTHAVCIVLLAPHYKPNSLIKSSS